MNTAREISFEFFPARTAEQRQVLESTWKELAPLKPRYLTVTFGAAGSKLDATRETVDALLDRTGIPVAPHISCMAQTADVLRQMLVEYRQRGVRRLVVLRGDRPPGQRCPGPFQHANELVEWVRREFPSAFTIEVACYPEYHPESESPASELRYFKQKVEAGADGAITQYFYNADSYFRFVDDCRRLGVDIPITPGIMPITNYTQLMRFSNLCGAEIPRWISKRLEGFGDDLVSLREFGLDVVASLCERLLQGGAPGLHIYTLNRSSATMRLMSRLLAPIPDRPETRLHTARR